MLSVKQHNENVNFSPELLAKFGEVVSRYPEGKQKSGLLPILHLVQAEYGWVSADAMDKVAVYLNILPIEVYEVATFYTMFLLQPKGKYVLEICRTGPCCLVGAERIMGHLEQKLGVKEGQVTADGLFSWRGVECLAACGFGPVLQIGPEYTFYENLTEDKVDELIDNLKAKTE
ncbi:MULTISPECIES: NADH-quinone oxidoreductase subunit NuoE family protein [Sphingobacterium]|jgi:NADH-quinone oxidoreductase subunit E|uniref:NADH-quinone oxidoreductase chain 2 n=1 Tax=Sphingobacterium multivorum TaxID=28454 RepID=A0A2X2IZW6_SPHMU|nr:MULTISPECIES: NAD(P)H-dependent oxidoreductase subunit E [Sphingobacterium]HAK28158.1 NAD(P)H-dependent oxidoreductase subunit E [Sphingobacterium sp.]MDF2852598.1 NAD(P)H-dependent oxidoreductase subunit [Sphingobacterium multivorum]OJZ10852.1 MAG: NAD(P)H-dependent oxidoreductase subunit E [Sphingobacterium sp. 40-24]QQT43207.1 NAD(P)H-dependent oxidoreductase subunit E [Sphingobacterium multivorum]QRQ60887.1 NAD(P)H-dependent oxidoreductase subunit E [Sphingobacterium multivorum]